MEPNVVSNVTNVDNRTTNVNIVNNTTSVVNNVTNIIQQPKLTAAERAMSIIRLQSSHRHFVGRERALGELKEWFLGGEWVHRQAGRAALLHGLGGMGKTELALRFANTWQSEFSFVYTIPAESAETRAGAYRQLATQLGVFLDEKSTPNQVRNRLFAHLEGAAFEKPYLLFYDNVEEGLEYPTRNGHLLITARNQRFVPKDLDVRKFELELMEEHEGLNLLKEWTGEEESPEMKELFRRLGGYPLVLAQVGGHIGSNPLRTVAKYLENHTVPQTAEDRYQQTLDQVLDVTLNALKDEAPPAFEWLQVCAYLNPDNIPLDYLERHLASEESREQLVLDLTNPCLMHFENETFSMHRHIQEALRKMDAEGEALKKASSLVAGIEFDFDEFDSFQQLQDQSTVWASHAELLLEGTTPSAARTQLLNQMGRFTNDILSLYEKALGYHQEALALAKQLDTNKGPQIGDSLYGIGYALYILGHYEESLNSYQQAFTVRKKAHGEEHPDVAICLNDMGVLSDVLGRHEEALKHLHQALAIRKQVYGDEHPRVATSLNDIGSALYSLERYEEALEHLRQALDIRKKVYGDEHPHVAISLGNIGSVLERLGRYEEALKYQQQTLDIEKKVYGDEHPHVAISMGNIGLALESLGRYEEALEHQQQALAIKKQVYGDEHPSVATSLNNIGSALDSLGRYEEALEYQQQALAISKQVYGDEHPHVAISLINIGNALYSLGRYEEALEHQQQALAIRKKVYGDEHPDVAASLNNIGNALDSLGRYEEALEYQQQALAISKQVYGDEHPHVAITLGNIGNVLKSLGRYEEALEYQQQALAIDKKVYGDEHPHVAISLYNMGRLLAKMQEMKGAKECFQQAVAIGEKVLPNNHPNLKLYREWLAGMERESKPQEPAVSNQKKDCSVM